MSKRKQTDQVMGSADRDTTDTATAERKKPQPKQVIDPLTHEWRDETRDEKFRRLAVQRMNNALKRIRQIGNLASRAQYDYNDEQADKILDALGEAVAEVAARFRRQEVPKGGFTF